MEHLQTLLQGSPILKRWINPQEPYQHVTEEVLDISTFCLDDDFKSIDIVGGKFASSPRNDQPMADFSSIVKTTLRISDIRDVLPDHGHNEDVKSLTLILSERRGMEMMCCNEEDYVAWFEGLTFLCKQAMEQTSGSRAGSPKSQVLEDGKGVEQLEETVARLSKENAKLKEIVRRKDDAIQQLMADLTRVGHLENAYNKTTSSSRESDTNHAERRWMILKRKNAELSKKLKEKDRIIDRLLGILQTQLLDKDAASGSASGEDSAGSAEIGDVSFRPPPRAWPSRVAARSPEGGMPLEGAMRSNGAGGWAAAAAGVAGARGADDSLVATRRGTTPSCHAALFKLQEEMAKLEAQKREVQLLATSELRRAGEEPGGSDDGFPLR